MNNKKALIIFARSPQIGKIKTRLASSFGDQKAFDIYNELLEIVQKYTIDLPMKKIIYWDNEIPKKNPFGEKWYSNKIQVKGDLGKKMKSAFNKEFNVFESICIIGSDCAELNSSIILNAFDSLEKKDIVLGPAYDGGYYLLGMNTLHESLFNEISWSSDKVLIQTLERIERLSLKYHRLQTLSDIDTMDDYENMRREKFIH